MAHLLIVDDEESICWGLGKLARGMGHTAQAVSSAERGLDSLRQTKPDVIVLDVRLPGMDGLTAMGRFREELGTAPIIVITAYGELDTAVEAVRRGAFEYLVKPFDLEVAQRAIQRALERPAAMELRSDGDPDRNRQTIVGSSAAMQEVFKRIAIVAPSEACVHIQGESGTGKELVARAIHQFSRRSSGSFVAVNAASLNESLVESELFGHVRGAFTGAESPRKGVFEQANGGTLFLDEAADIPPAIQVKLLRVLEYGEVTPVGANQPTRSDFRVITATHQDLRRKVQEGSFREDLYFRLATFEIEIPPLRQRRDDIGELTRHFLDLLSAKNGCPRPSLAESTVLELASRRWHGNVRELRHALEHALLLSRGGILLPEHLPVESVARGAERSTLESRIQSTVREWAEEQFDGQGEASDLYQRLLDIVEPPLLETVLERHRGQFLSASRQLGLHRVTLKRKMDRGQTMP